MFDPPRSKWAVLVPGFAVAAFFLEKAYRGIVLQHLVLGGRYAFAVDRGAEAVGSGFRWLLGFVLIVFAMWKFHRWYEDDEASL